MSILDFQMVGETLETPKLKEWYVKPIEMLCNNWAYIKQNECEVYFVRDIGVIFDYLKFDSIGTAHKKLLKNGFIKLITDKEALKYIVPPETIVDAGEYSREPIYSTGEYWIS